MAVGLDQPVADVYAKLTRYANPNPMQMEVWNHFIEDSELGIGLLLKGPTGSGKTEAIAVPALAAGYRLIMAYPTRSLVDDQVGRFSTMLCNFSKHNGDRPVVLNIDTGAVSERISWRNGEQVQVSGNTRRHLYQGDVIITTLDKFLYRFFGFGEPMKSYTFPLRINHGLRRTLICFDEAHSYEDVAFTNFAHLVRTLYERGKDVALMTATLPEKHHPFFHFLTDVDFVANEVNRKALSDFNLKHFPKRNHPTRYLHLVSAVVTDGEMLDANLIDVLTQEALQRVRQKQRMIVIAERVPDAVMVWRNLRQALGTQTEVLLYHGRLTQPQRKRVYQKLLDAEGEGTGYLLVSTSAIEVGCDLDAHVLITQLCDPDRLIQRAGRCNRRQRMSDAQVVVVGSEIPAWLTSLSEKAFEAYWQELQTQDGSSLNPQPLLACLQTEPKVDYRIEMMFNMLYEYVYEAKLENKPLHDKGLVLTRSWEPSLTLCTGFDEKNRPLNAISVSIRYCKAGEDESADPEWAISKIAFDRHENEYTCVPLGGWECAYTVDAVVYPEPFLLYDNIEFNEEEGWVEIPKVFNGGFRNGYRRVLIRSDSEGEHRLWYIADLEEPEPQVIREVEESSEEVAEVEER